MNPLYIASIAFVVGQIAADGAVEERPVKVVMGIIAWACLLGGAIMQLYGGH